MAPCRIGGLEQTSGAGNLMQSHLVIWLHSIRVTLPAAPRILLCAPLGTQEKPGPFGGSGKFCPGRMELVFLLLLWSGHSLLIQLEQHFCGCAGHVHDPSACNALPRDRHEMPRHPYRAESTDRTSLLQVHTLPHLARSPLPFFALIVAPSQYLITVDMLCISLACLFSAWLSPVPRTASASAGTGFSQHP